MFGCQNQNIISGTGFVPDLDISLVSQPDEVAIFPGDRKKFGNSTTLAVE